LPTKGCEFLLEGMKGAQAVMLLRKPRVQVVHVSLFKSEKKQPIYTVGQAFAPWRISHCCVAGYAAIRSPWLQIPNPLGRLLRGSPRSRRNPIPAGERSHSNGHDDAACLNAAAFEPARPMSN
jgi:hypothetical protein